MIKGLTSSSQFLIANIANGQYIGSYGISAGNLRYNTSNSSIEVYDGNNWQHYGNYGSIGLSFEAEEAIKWANKKRLEELQLKEKMEKYPSLKDAYEQFKIVEALVYEVDQNAT